MAALVVLLWVFLLAAGGAEAVGSGGTAATAAAAAAPPRLGELYLPPGRGRDWSLVGYKNGKAAYKGKAALPTKRPIYNVRAPPFNAKGDGVADDTGALMAAVIVANTDPAGGVIYLPAGTYKLTRPLTITSSNVVIRGEGRVATTIYIPVSLSDVFQGTWTMDSNGNINSAWSFGGAFITFAGRRQSSSDPRTRLAAVNAPVEVGTSRIPVDRTAGFTLGQWVRIFVNDRSTQRRLRKLAEAAQPAAAGRKGGIPLSSVKAVRAPDWVQQHPAFQAAMEGAQLLRDAGSGLTPQQAAAADAELSAASTGDFLPAAADGTLVAWIYGDGRADSGSDGVVDEDEVSTTARVVEIGAGWVQLDRELPFPVRPGWEGVVHAEVPTVQDSGIERLTIRFKHTIVGPHFTDRGYNAIQLSKATDTWVRRVRILNADNGIFLGWVDRSTLEDVKVNVTKPRWAPSASEDQHNGHHAISIGEGHSNMVVGFNIAAKYVHDITVAAAASMNVFRVGRGLDVNLDHHRAGPFANLFTNIDLGRGTRPFESGGKKTRGAYTGRGSTFWGLVATGGGLPHWKPTRSMPSGSPPLPAGRPTSSSANKPLPATLGGGRPQNPGSARPHRKLGQLHVPQAAPAAHTTGAAGGPGAQAQLRLEGGSRGSGDGLPRSWAVAPGSSRPLPLPGCDFGPFLNFVGSYAGPRCGNMGWLVMPLRASSPRDLYLAQTRIRARRRKAVAAAAAAARDSAAGS